MVTRDERLRDVAEAATACVGIWKSGARPEATRYQLTEAVTALILPDDLAPAPPVVLTVEERLALTAATIDATYETCDVPESFDQSFELCIADAVLAWFAANGITLTREANGGRDGL